MTSGSRAWFGRASWAVLLVFGVGVLFGFLAAVGRSGTGFSPDSFSYLEMARSLQGGLGVSSRILFVDSPVAVPSPVVWWPPGYPTAIAGVTIVGIPVDIAARFVSISAFGITGALVWSTSRAAYNWTAAWLALPMILLAPALLNRAAEALSESLTMALIMVAAYFAVRHSASSEVRITNLLLIAFGLAGASLVHYKALAMVPLFAAGVLMMRRSGSTFSKRLGYSGLVIGISLLPIGLWLLRNLRVAGSATGSRDGGVLEGVIHHAGIALRSLAADTLFLVKRVTLLPELLEWRLTLVAVVGLAAIVMSTALWIRGGERFSAEPSTWTEAQVFLAFAGIGYIGLMVLIRSFLATSVDPLNSRQLVLAYPLIIMTAAGLISRLLPSDESAVRKVAAAAMATVLLAGGLLLVPQALDGAERGRLNASPGFTYLGELEGLVEPDSLFVGNQLDEAPWLSGTAVLTFSAYEYTQSTFDCWKIAAMVDQLDPQTEPYLLLHGEGEPLTATRLEPYGTQVQQLFADSLNLGLEVIFSNELMSVYSLNSGMNSVCSELAGSGG